ncbi:uncharacterized protein EDB91DRAFT_1239214 [Suillus paluster]|uniref:uncharacterized protein n=1 Tax=Suillus paluster TaxID=48578 RepID=UPI001B868491|nr:uncharacterized protein EDB91DRAFT_1239214 [Suillus paluster]KAG1729494.1 hypothetical protein EDB91DRAFT_1239214 [Suillus paluster]
MIQDHPLLSWIDYRELFLLEMLHHNGRGDDISLTFCNTCGIMVGSYHYKDCFMSTLSCQMCVVGAHTYSPAHRVEKWNSECFQNVTLKDLGLHVQLGHKVGESCLLPSQAFNDNFILIDTLGIHPMAVDFCGCDRAQSHTEQLLRVGWFPAMTSDLRTAATFCVLWQFHVLSFESKISAYEFYHSLVRMMDNTGLLKHRDHYKVIIATQQGECAVLCLVCPQPGKNLPDDWELAPKGKRWLYGLFLAIDANFCLKRQIISKDTVDPSLSHGWGDVTQKSTCVSHNAVNMAESKSSNWHNMKLLNGVGDLQKGERYINMDFLFFSTLRHRSLKVLNMMFSFNWSCWVGCTDGEAPEQGWLNINPVASSTKEMGPGCRWDTLDDHFGDWNWKKVVNLGANLLCKTKEAMLEKVAFHATFKELDAAITEEHHIAWKAEVERWEENPNDPSVSNPFEAKSVAITQAGAHLKLVQLEAKELEQGADVSLHPEVSPSILIGLGLDLEEEQFMKGLGNHIMDTQKGNLLHQRNGLNLLYMPVAHDALEELRQCLHICSSLLTYKKDWVHRQGANTGAQNALEHVTGRQAACTARYHASWEALNTLARELGKVGWEQGLWLLEPDDIQPLIDPDILPGQGRQKLTWIWRMHGVDSSGDGTDEDGVRVEWCKARAHTMCWAKEVELLHEEMCRVLQFFRWQATWWDEQGYQCVEEDTGCLEGIRAYAAKQAKIHRAFIDHFQILWSLFLLSSPDAIALSNIILSGADHPADLPDLSAPRPPEI